MKKIHKTLITILSIVTLVLFSSSICKADDIVTTAAVSSSGANLTVTGEATGYAVSISVLDSNNNVVDFMTVAISNSNTYTATFTMTSSGSYQASVLGYDPATNATAVVSDSITVTVPKSSSSTNTDTDTNSESDEENTTTTDDTTTSEDSSTESVINTSNSGSAASTSDNNNIYIYLSLMFAAFITLSFRKRIAKL